MSDAISLTFVELSKLSEIVKKPVGEMTALDKWSVFFQYAPDPNYREAVNKVIESEEVLQVAGELLMSISQNEQERAIFRSRKKFQTDLQSDLATAEDRGRAEGILMSIQNLMDGMGLTIEQAMNILKVSEEDRSKYRSIMESQS